MLRQLIGSLRTHGIESEAFFERDIGGGYLFRAACPTHWMEQGDSLAQVLRGGKFDLVHAVTSSLTLGVAESVAAARFAGPMVASCHGDYVLGWNRSNANLVIALTEFWAGKIRRFTDVPVTVIGNPVDLERFPGAEPDLGDPPARRPVGWVGHSADPRKNIDALKELVARVDPSRWCFHVADTDAHPTAEDVFGAHADRLASYGFVEPDGMPAFYARLVRERGVLLCTSQTEGFPLCLLEAMACGCPVIAPDDWGAADMLGPAGLVYNPADPSASISTRLEETRRLAVWDRLHEAGRSRAEERYSLASVTRQYLEAFRSAAQTPRRNDAGYHCSRGLRDLATLFQPMPTAVWRHRPRRAADALDRAVRAGERGRICEVRTALREAVLCHPGVFNKPWRLKFLVRNLLGTPAAPPKGHGS